MKIEPLKVKVSRLTHEDLVRLLSTGVVDGDGAFSLEYDKDDYDGLPDDVKSPDDCLEDKAAKILLAGKSVEVVDWDADGEYYGGADLVARVEDDGEVRYAVNMQAIADGLENAANGDFISSGTMEKDILQERRYVRKAFDSFAQGEDSDDFDADYAQTLVQVILFNEVIYC